jgi:tyrosinase
VLSQSTTAIRLEWQQFKTTTQYASFINAVRTMRANSNALSPASWAYWTNVHVNYCPHGIPYFLAWHRGYIHYLEQQLRAVSGDNTLNLPYWDYYKYPTMPAEFTDPSTNNPLYVPRTGTSVYNALTLSPFASTVWNFQRGTTNAFEPLIESAPHNPVHNLIGGIMATMQSPNDPIFYLHHAQIDRLWHAWAMPNGKGIPPTSNPYSAATSNAYWAGSFTYSSTMTMPKYLSYYPGWLGDDYANDTPPSVLPPLVKTSSPFKLVQAQMEPQMTRPAVADLPVAAPRAISANSRSLGGVTDARLGETSASLRLPLQASHIQALQDTLATAVGSVAQPGAGIAQSVKVVLDNLQLLGAGAKGGFFYNVYLNLPAAGDVTDVRQKHFLGTVGPFEIAGASHHGPAKLELHATEVLAGLSPSQLKEIVISIARVSGENAPHGEVLRIGEARIEVSTDAPWDRSSRAGLQPGQCYC